MSGTERHMIYCGLRDIPKIPEQGLMATQFFLALAFQMRPVFPILNREIAAPWQYNMLTRAAEGRALTQSETQTEGGEYYEYIRGIYGAFDYWTSDRCNSEFEK